MMIRTSIAFLCLTLLAGLALAEPTDEVVVLELKSGTKLPGRVATSECTEDALVIWLLRPRAKRTIPWSEINDEQARKLRIALGFEVEEASAGLQVTAHRIRNRAGSTFIGLWLNKDKAEREGEYKLKTSDGMRRIPIGDVRDGPTEVQVDALAVYTPTELYEQRIAEGEPKTALDHFRVAEFCRTIGALEQAKMHYETVLTFEDSPYSPASVQRALDRVLKAIGSKEARESLIEIKRAIVYKNWAKANALLAAFREAYKDDADFLADADEIEEGLKAKRTEYFTTLIGRNLRDTVKDLIAAKVKEKVGPEGEELTLRQAQQYAGGEVSSEESASYQAVMLLSEKYEISPEEVLEFWANRLKRMPHKAFYRDGTFIVLEDLQDALARAPKLKTSKKGPKPPRPHSPKTPDSWWKEKRGSRKYAEMRDFLYAWWAENAGLVDLLEPKYETCQTCAGKGYTQTMVSTAGGTVPFIDRCQTCHMATKFRVVRFQ
jgi:hypothetical protein